MNSLTVLIVDDHQDTLEALRRLLQSVGYVVLTADSAQTAKTIAQTQPFDVLIADLELVDGNGWELLADLKATSPGPFGAIALSGHAYPEHREKSRDAGFSVHLSKPCTVDKLLSAIVECRAHHR